MKKVNGKYLLTVFAIFLAISIAIGYIGAIAGGAKDIVYAGNWFAALLFIGFLFFYCFMGEIITDRFVSKTMEKNSKEANFQDYSTFYSSGATIRIEEGTGRIAYVSNQNPFQFQVVSAKDITDIKSNYIKGPFGGTRYVYFEFAYLNKKVRIPTFTSRNMYSLESEEVLEAISKADRFAEMLENAKANAS